MLQNWGDIVDLCAKDRAIGHGAETTMDVDEAMSRETNEVEFMGLDATAIDLEEPSSNTKGKRQGLTSSSTDSHRRKIGEKEGITISLDKMVNSFDRMVEKMDRDTSLLRLLPNTFRAVDVLVTSSFTLTKMS